jgi:hypothetical protein
MMMIYMSVKFLQNNAQESKYISESPAQADTRGPLVAMLSCP